MKYWIFTVTGHSADGRSYTPEEIFEQRMKDRFWGIGQKTPNRKNLEKGDKVVYYVGHPEKVFACVCTLGSSAFELSDSQRQQYGHGWGFYTSEYGVLLEDIDIWQTPKSVEELVPQLAFIENKEFWFSYFQGGVRQITEEDFRTITGSRETTLVEQLATARDIESQSQFALEAHLEEFIYQNWERIDWGAKLDLYTTDEQNGRQFPAGTWSIDFLALDAGKNELVVVELKKGKTSDSAVGQLLRYMNWVKENVAEKGQNVRGIIVAKEIDEALKYSIMDSDAIDVKTYRVDFRLA